MTPDVKLKNFYLQFIFSAKADVHNYNEELKTVINIKNELYNYVENNKQLIKDSFDINLDDFSIEWNQKCFNPKMYLYNIVIVLVKNAINHEHRGVLLQLIKYCNILRTEHKYNKLIEFANNRKNITLKEYKKYISNYYIKVHKCVLQGMGYKFDGGIGTYVINYWKLDPAKIKKKPRLDYAATNAKKKELIAKGIKVYDEKEAIWYKARHIPYDAVDYRVYRENTNWYEFTFIKSVIFKSNNLDYKHTEYVNSKLRGMSYKDMAEKLCKNEEDIYNLQVDIKYKLNVLLSKNPNSYLNFIRNATQNKYEPGAHNS